VGQLEESDNLEVDAASIVQQFEKTEGRRLLYQICHV
jgi:hypothetical protein